MAELKVAVLAVMMVVTTVVSKVGPLGATMADLMAATKAATMVA